MSLHETPMVLRYWQRVGGTLIEEYRVVQGGPDRGHRDVDAVILPARPLARLIGVDRPDVSLAGQEVIVVQAKASRLGMYLLGQALFSRHLVELLGAAPVRTVALCNRDDAVLRPLAERYGIEVVVDPPG